MKLTKGSSVTLRGDPKGRVGKIVSDCRGVRAQVKWEHKAQVMTHRLDQLEPTQRSLI